MIKGYIYQNWVFNDPCKQITQQTLINTLHVTLMGCLDP